MASTYSNLKFELITTGEQTNTWGTTTNINLGTAIEEAIVGRATVTFVSDANLTISLTDTNTTQTARNYILNVVSVASLTATRDLIVPTINKPYIVENNTTGGQAIRIKTSAGTGVTIPNGNKCMVYTNGTNVVSAADYFATLTTGSLTTGSMTTGSLTTGSMATSGNITFSSAGSRITGDFTDATIANRVLFQTSTTNGATNVTQIPNGASTDSSYQVLNSSDTTNHSYALLSISASEVAIKAEKRGTGTYLPLVFYTSGSEQFRVTPLGVIDGAKVSAINSGQIAGFRNKIINGKMDIAQRGTSFAAIAASTYSLDRWLFANTSSAVITASQQADVPSSNEFQSSLRLAVTTADTSIAAGDICNIQQRIEGYNVRDLIGRTFTLSFWVRSSKTGIHCIAVKNGANDRSYIAEYTINASNTWEYKTVTVPSGLIIAGAWNWTTGLGLSVTFALAAGSTYQTTAGAWQTGNYIATANQVNCLDTIGNIFAITGVQLESGTVATPFEHRPYGAELALCQRYYEKSFQQATAPAVNVGSNNGAAYFPQPAGASLSVATLGVTFKERKRASPTSVVIYSPTSAQNTIRNATISADWSSPSAVTVGETGFALVGTTPAGSAAGNSSYFHWTAEAEL